MPKRALSKLKERSIYSKAKDRALLELVESITEAQKDAARRGEKRPLIAKQIDQYNKSNNTSIPKSTVYQHLLNPQLPTKAQSFSARRLLNESEENTLIAVILNQAERGFPLTTSGVARYALELACIRNPLLSKIGENWVTRFYARHEDKLSTVWSKSLDKSRAAAVNPTSINHYYDLLTAVMDKYEFEEGNIYGFDESGFPAGGDESRERVVTAKSVKTQHQASEAKGENITAMVTICGDGSWVTPTVIFKGKNMHASWADSNHTLKMNIAMSEKGWTDSEIGVAWLRDFDQRTKAKANNGASPRLLLLDGHNSHFTFEFIDYAMKANIIIFCYPAHCTHVLQGLDIVAFAVLKRVWNGHRREWINTNYATLDKDAWLEVWSTSFLDAMTEENVRASFKATGVIPLDRSVITPKMMAPQPGSVYKGIDLGAAVKPT